MVSSLRPTLGRRNIVKRQHDRVQSGFSVECRAGGQAFKAVLSDVSVGGCMIEIPAHRLSISDRICIKVDNGIRMSGMVVWHTSKNAGIRFDQCLHEAVVSFLGFSPKKLMPAKNAPSDRFGRPLPRLRSNYRPAALCVV